MRRILSTAVMAVALSGLIGGLSTPAAIAGGSCHEATTSASGVRVELTGLCFQPTVLFVAPGGKVTWTNHDSFPHNVTGLGFSWASNGDLSPGRSFTQVFEAEGVYPYACYLHPGMVGAVVVGNPGPTGSGSAAAVPVVPSAPGPAAPATQAEGSKAIATAGSSPWRAVSLVALGVFVVTTLGLIGFQRSQRRRSRPVAAG